MKRGGKDIESLDSLRVLSLFSGCGGMDLGFEGDFICHRKSISPQNTWVQEVIDEHWVRLQKNRFRTVFANDILKEAQTAWLQYMDRFGYDKNVYNTKSIVDLVKEHRAGKKVFPKNIDVVTGGFPCQDFSVSGKRLGFESNKDHTGKLREDDEPRKRRGVNLLLDEAGDRYYETQDIYRGEREGTGESGRREKYYSERLRPCGWGWIYCFRSSSFTCGQLWGSGV